MPSPSPVTMELEGPRDFKERVYKWGTGWGSSEGRSLLEAVYKSFCCSIWTSVKLGNVAQRGEDRNLIASCFVVSSCHARKTQNQVFTQ